MKSFTRQLFTMICGAAALVGGPLIGCGAPAPPDEAVQATRSAAAGHLSRARAALEAGRIAVAGVALDAAAELTPRDPAVQRERQRALICAAATRPGAVTEEAAARLSYAIELLADDPTMTAASAVVRARLALLRGDGDAALSELAAALTADPGYVPAHLLRADLLAQGGDTEGALATLERACEVAPNDPAALDALGAARLARGRVDEGEALLRRSLALKEGASVRVHLADVALRRGQVAEAVAELRRAVALAPADTGTRRQLAALLKQTGDTAGAESALQQVLLLEPDAWAAFTLGQICQDEGRQAEAADHFRRALQLDPSAFAPAWHLAAALQAEGDGAGAARALRRYLEASEGVDGERERRERARELLAASGQAPSP